MRNTNTSPFHSGNQNPQEDRTERCVIARAPLTSSPSSLPADLCPHQPGSLLFPVHTRMLSPRESHWPFQGEIPCMSSPGSHVVSTPSPPGLRSDVICSVTAVPLSVPIAPITRRVLCNFIYRIRCSLLPPLPCWNVATLWTVPGHRSAQQGGAGSAPAVQA